MRFRMLSLAWCGWLSRIAALFGSTFYTPMLNLWITGILLFSTIYSRLLPILVALFTPPLWVSLGSSGVKKCLFGRLSFDKVSLRILAIELISSFWSEPAYFRNSSGDIFYDILRLLCDFKAIDNLAKFIVLPNLMGLYYTKVLFVDANEASNDDF